MMLDLRCLKWTTVGLAAGLALMASGCDSLQLNGKIFDATGLGGSGAKEEPRLSERAPLVPPPTTQQLPAPGALAPKDQVHMAWPVDPEKRQQAIASATAEQRKAYCNDQMFGRPEPEIRKRDAECRSSLFTTLTDALPKFSKARPPKEAENEGDLPRAPKATASQSSGITTGSIPSSSR